MRAVGLLLVLSFGVVTFRGGRAVRRGDENSWFVATMERYPAGGLYAYFNKWAGQLLMTFGAFFAALAMLGLIGLVFGRG